MFYVNSIFDIECSAGKYSANRSLNVLIFVLAPFQSPIILLSQNSLLSTFRKEMKNGKIHWTSFPIWWKKSLSTLKIEARF